MLDIETGGKRPIAAIRIMVNTFAKADILKTLGDLQQTTGRIS